MSDIDLTGFSSHERVTRVYALFPQVPDWEIGKLSGVSAATIKKYRETLKMQTIEETTNDRW